MPVAYCAEDGGKVPGFFSNPATAASLAHTFALFANFIAAFALAAMLSGCSNTPDRQVAAGGLVDLAAANLPALAAEYRTVFSAGPVRHQDDATAPAAETVVWRFWRDDGQIVVERPQLGLGELWQRDGKTLIHLKLYHRERRAIEFQEDDLKMLGGKPAWQKLALSIDPALLAQLAVADPDWLDGKPIREYRGSAAGAEWHVIFRLDLALPILIERVAHGESERTEMVDAYPLSAAPWRPTASDSYDIIDYADLGDKEYDPFVVKVQTQIGHGHRHSH